MWVFVFLVFLGVCGFGLLVWDFGIEIIIVLWFRLFVWLLGKCFEWDGIRWGSVGMLEWLSLSFGNIEEW